MNTQIRYAAYSLIAISIVLTLLLAYPEANTSRAKARAVVPAADLRAATTDSVPETVTLSAESLKTWRHSFGWAEKHWYWDDTAPAFKDDPWPEDIPASIVVGFKHRYDKGAVVAGCPDGHNSVYRGTVWFDLSEIMKKAPPLHISVKSATLHFNQTVACPGELLVGTADWMKGYPDNTLVPGDSVPLATLPSGFRTSKVPSEVLAGPCEACILEVETVVNNWVKGEEHGGYPNY